MAKKNEIVECSFCGKPKEKTKLMIGGMGIYICDECVVRAYQLVEEETKISNANQASTSKIATKKFKPIDIKKYLDDYVIGQVEAKKTLAVAVYNHYKRVNQIVDSSEVEIEKSNVIVIGQTGTGKTLLARSIAKYLDLPFTIVDATVFTEAGYVGEDVESILTRLLQVCDYNVEQAERGIVYIDEIDKIGRKGDNPSLTRDVKEGTQQALLKLLEGSEILVPPQGGRKHPEQKFIKLNTKNILFLCGGAFDGIEKIIGKRITTRSIGYGSNKEMSDAERDNILQYVNQHDLKKYGLIPELIGRLPVVVHLDVLDKKALRSILTEPKNALMKQYEKLFELEGIKLTVEKEVLNFIVDQAFEHKLGARGLRSMCELLMKDLMFELPSKDLSEYTLTLDYAESKLSGKQINKLKAA
ncbi:MAG: ATP-dependent Clp protease ATP-binding subunit ClpX [Bacteroidota bacterium]|jgi:ATP-dependent Clp protease ATP-binding subunit ClpX